MIEIDATDTAALKRRSGTSLVEIKIIAVVSNVIISQLFVTAI